jgi:chromosome segregation ATPase
VLDELSGELSLLNEKVAGLETQNGELTEALGQSDGELSMLKMEMEDKTKEADESSLKAAATLEELSSVQKELDERTAELEATLEAYGDAQEEFQKVKNNLERELEHAKVKMQALEEAGAALGDQQSEMVQLRADKASAEMKVEQLSSEAAALSDKVKASDAELKRTKQERDEAIAERDEAKAQGSSLSEQRALLEQKLSAANDRSSELEESAGAMAGKMEELEARAPVEKVVHVAAPAAAAGEALAHGLTEEEMLQGNTMMTLLDAYTSKVEEQIDAQQKLIVMLNEDEEEDDDDEGEREEIMAQLEQQMYETEDEKSAARVKCIAYAREINLIFKRADDEKAQMQRQYKFQFARAKAAFDVVKDKLMKNIQERASALKAVRGELETKEQALRRTQRQKQEAERGLLEMRGIFEDMKRIEHMKRGCEVLKYHQAGGAPQIRWLQLAHDESEVRWAENRKSSSWSSIPVREVQDVIIGWESAVFKKCPRDLLEKPWKCISIMSEKRTFDCSLKTEDDVITWCRGIMALVCIRPGRTAPTVDSMRKRMLMYRESFEQGR